jgi:MOSC domain-containing protein YiiM
MTESVSLEQRLQDISFSGPSRLHALIQKPAVGVHVRVYQAVVEAGKGLIGDHDKKDWWKGKRIPEREVTAISREVMEALNTDVDVPGDNIVFEGVDLRGLQPGSLVRVGSSVVLKRAAKYHRPCDLFARRISEDARKAVLDLNLRGALFSVVQGGTLKTGDAITIDESS